MLPLFFVLLIRYNIEQLAKDGKQYIELP